MANVRRNLLIAIILSAILLLSCVILGNASIKVDAENVQSVLRVL